MTEKDARATLAKAEANDDLEKEISIIFRVIFKSEMQYLTIRCWVMQFNMDLDLDEGRIETSHWDVFLEWK